MEHFEDDSHGSCSGPKPPPSASENPPIHSSGAFALPGPALLRMAILSDVVRQTRQELGISLQELAARCSLREEDVLKFETEDPGWLRLGELARLLHVIGCRLEVSAIWDRPDLSPPAVLKAQRPGRSTSEAGPW
jgi:hypothetical protein